MHYIDGIQSYHADNLNPSYVISTADMPIQVAINYMIYYYGQDPRR